MKFMFLNYLVYSAYIKLSDTLFMFKLNLWFKIPVNGCASFEEKRILKSLLEIIGYWERIYYKNILYIQGVSKYVYAVLTVIFDQIKQLNARFLHWSVS